MPVRHIVVNSASIPIQSDAFLHAVCDITLFWIVLIMSLASYLRQLCGADEPRVLAQLVSNQFKQFVSNAFAAIAVTLALVYFFAAENLMPSVIAWATGYSALATYMLFKLWQYHRIDESRRNYQYWHKIGLIIVGVSGCFWGGMPFAFYPVEQALTIEMITIGLTVAAISASVMISLPGGFTLYGIAAISLQASAIFIYRPDYMILGLGALVFMGLAVVANIRATRLVARAALLNFQNQDLLAEAKHQRDKAERADESKSRFIAAASHDLRQPLHALSLVASARELSHPDDHFARSIRKNVASLDGLFNAILDISVLDAGKQAVNIKPMRCNALEEVIENSPLLQQLKEGVTFELQLSDDVCLCDPDLVLQVLFNLLGNAIKYTEQGKITVASGIEQGRVFFEVADTGIGMESSDLERIWEEFYQVDNPTRDRSKGIGLGLAIVQRLASLMDAQLQCDSAPGEGSQFRLWLPVSKEIPDLIRNEVDDALDVSHGNHELILIIEDDQEILNAYHDLLNQWNFIPLLAQTEEQAMNLVAEFADEISVLICDYRLSHHMTGNVLIEKIRHAMGRSVPAIMITGDTAVKEVELLSDLNIPVMFKPLDSAALNHKIHHLIDKG